MTTAVDLSRCLADSDDAATKSWRRQNEAFERWLQELRRTSAAQIVLHDENIARLAAELDAEMEAGRAGATGQP